jgi:hypothetical protein
VKWINHAETLHQKKVKFFHSDGGGEYVNKYLLSFLSGKGIQVEQTCADTPQHNGVVERANRTVFEMARAMLMHASLPVVFWGEAVLTACYLMNMRLCVNDKSKTCYEVWHGHKPVVRHLRVFGCDVYVHIAKHDRAKMDAKSVKGIFIGYDRVRENGYRVYDITNHKVIISRDVQFFESVFTAAKELISGVRDESPAGDYLSLPNPWDLHLQLNPLTNAQPPASTASQLQSNVEQSDDFDFDNKHHEDDDDAHDYNTDSHTETSINAPSSSHSDSSAPTIVTSNVDPRFASSLSWADSGSQLDIPSVSASSQPTRRTNRNSKPPSRYFAYASVEDENMPQTYKEAMSSVDSAQWKKAIDDEISSIKENDTFTYVKRSDLPAGANIMDYRWVFKVKLNAAGKIERYKARLVAKGFTQKEGIDYHETFAPVVRYKSLRIIIVIANLLDYELTQMDVITAFLYALLHEDVYMRVPEGFERLGYVLKLRKSLYGTKQAPHMWNNELNVFIVSCGFTRLASDVCVYVKRTQSGNMIIISVFVDDIVAAYAKSDEREWLVVKKLFMSKYKMKDLGDVNWILGMKLTRDRARGVLTLDQSLYLNKVLDRYGMSDSKPVSTPETVGAKLSINDCPSSDEEKENMRDVPYMSAVGSLLYAALGTRPDIAHAVNVASKFMSNPGQSHWLAVKRIMRYIKGTINQSLTFTAKDGIVNDKLNVNVYSDADWAGDLDDRRSTTGYVVCIGNSTVIWSTKKQKTVSLSSAEAEYMALAAATQEAKWVNQFLCELFSVSGMSLSVDMSVHVDNQAAILMSKNDVYHDRTKHIDLRYHYVREAVQSGLYKLEWVSTDKQLADGFTKSLSSTIFNKHFSSIMNL